MATIVDLNSAYDNAENSIKAIQTFNQVSEDNKTNYIATTIVSRKGCGRNCKSFNSITRKQKKISKTN
jgi:hypothetical protein